MPEVSRRPSTGQVLRIVGRMHVLRSNQGSAEATAAAFTLISRGTMTPEEKEQYRSLFVQMARRHARNWGSSNPSDISMLVDFGLAVSMILLPDPVHVDQQAPNHD